ncbi:hypothetical protein [Neotabrizicola sp. VNH66]|uniref:hypothetical protein n=1 Tax=Neotabrizicola sp. VNH66 TaxID=3400918 RepID=UPI003C09A7F5
MAQTFADWVDDWTRESEARLLAVFRRAVELLADELTTTRANGGRLPHLTGNLMRSLLAAVGAMPSQGAPDQKYAGSDVGVVVASVLMGQSISLGFQAVYARRRNYGFVGTRKDGSTWSEPGAGFVEYAASVWPTIVALAAEEIRNKVMARSA